MTHAVVVVIELMMARSMQMTCRTVACMRLHQALRRQHRRRMQARHSGIADRVRAGPAGEDSIGNGDEDGDAPLSMLHTWATHVMVRQRVASDLGIMAVGVNEPRVAVHWSSPGACVSTADVTVRVGGAGQETLLLTVDGAEVTALSMHGRRDVLSEAAVPAYVMQHIASAMVRALTQTALARGWRVVRRHGLSIAVQRRLTLVKVNVKPSLQPFAIAVVVEVDTQVWPREKGTWPMRLWGAANVSEVSCRRPLLVILRFIGRPSRGRTRLPSSTSS